MKHTIAAIIATLSLTSCISDDVTYCPPLHIVLGVKDKNYSNIDRARQWEEKLQADLPFSEYVPTLYYTLRNVATGEIVEEQTLMQTDDSRQTLDLGFCECVPHGTYVFTAYGGMSTEDVIDKATGCLTLHEGTDEGEDTYLCNDTILYDADHNGYYEEMERAKDKLIVVTEGIPHDATMRLYARGVAQKANPFQDVADTRFEYLGHANVYKDFTHADETAKVILAPSEGYKTTTLHAAFIQDGVESDPDDVAIDLDRNALTIVKYAYDKDRGYTVYILVNGTWEIVSKMDVD